MLNKLIKSALIVDPNKYQAQLLSQMLQGEGVTSIKHYLSASEAMDALTLLAPDAIFLEAELPGTDGLEFTQAFRRSPQVRRYRAPIFLMTSRASNLTVAQAMDAGANALLLKPLAPGTTVTAVRKVLESPRPFIEVASYVGPCRRIGAVAQPNPCPRRREEDRVMERAERMAERDILVRQLGRDGPAAATNDPAAVGRTRKAAQRLADVALLLGDEEMHWAAGAIGRMTADTADAALRKQSLVLFEALTLLSMTDSDSEKRKQIADYIRAIAAPKERFAG